MNNKQQPAAEQRNKCGTPVVLTSYTYNPRYLGTRLGTYLPTLCTYATPTKYLGEVGTCLHQVMVVAIHQQCDACMHIMLVSMMCGVVGRLLTYFTRAEGAAIKYNLPCTTSRSTGFGKEVKAPSTVSDGSNSS